MSNLVKIAHFTFNLPLKHYELVLWRERFLQMFSPEVGIEILSPLEGSYPLIQFCRIGKQAGIVAIGAGIQAIKYAIAIQSWSFFWQNKSYPLGIIQIDTLNHQFFHLDIAQPYLIEAYLPFSSASTSDPKMEWSLLDQVQILQKRFNEHLQLLTNELYLNLQTPIQAQLTHLDRSKVLSRKTDSSKVYHLRCKCSLSLPAMLGLGEGAAYGLGRIIQL